MDYYEELGIHRDATSGEIREAYKLAVRLVHPDKQMDPRLKHLAECQMKRLSDVLAVLANPRERARYDAGLARGARPALAALLSTARRPELLQTAVRHWFWVLLGSMTIGMGVWYGLARGTVIPSVSGEMERARVAAGPVKREERAPVKKRREKTAVTKSAGRAEPAQPLRDTLREESQAGVIATPLAAAPIPDGLVAKVEHGAVAAPQIARPTEVAPGGGESRFTGQWLYVADTREEDRAARYPARYVEFRLREAKGALAGDYRAVHRLLDKAISPEVVFRVSGESPQGNSGKLDWESSAGAKGELELTLQSPDQLQVKWWTTQFGRREALTSGMAVLMRLKTP